MDCLQDSDAAEEKADPIFQNNVIFMKSLVGKSVLIETCDKVQHRGTIYVIDPIFKTVVLVLELNNETEFILHSAMKSLTVLSDSVCEEFLEKPEPAIEISEEILSRKESLKKHFESMHIPVEEYEDFLVVQEHVRIEPPYSRNNCICDNPLVLQRITKLFDAM